MVHDISKSLFSGTLEVSYSGFTIEPLEPDYGDSNESDFAGQVNGLCGGATLGRLVFTARPKDSTIRLEVRLHSSRPPTNLNYSEIVEVSFRQSVQSAFLCQWGHEKVFPLELPHGEYRIRYSVEGLDKEYDEQDEDCDTPISGQLYLIDIWPGQMVRDEIVKQTTSEAAYWHNTHGTRTG